MSIRALPYETNNFWLGWFYVHSDYEKKGYGEHLFKFVKEILKLSVDTSSNEFYQTALLQDRKYRFKLEAVLKNYYEKNEDQLMLSIDI
ncbi:MAG: GNAT family N-acetyltransferase [Deltaproteobacteria bacterium]|nr:GNAT family N-acetyltransferase [Deltaproteobacteria bacterium]